MADATNQNTTGGNKLHALPAPLKSEYREQRETARTPARAEAVINPDCIACGVPSWGVETNVGLIRRKRELLS